MKIEIKALPLIIIVFFASCNHKLETKMEFKPNRELVPNPESLQKDSFTITNKNEEDCKCAENKFTESKTDTIYQLSNGKRIALCGYRNVENKPVNFSEFVLSVCGEKQIIDFWDATETCDLRINSDTLFVEELIDLPTNKNRIYASTIWSIEKLYFENEQLKRKKYLNQKIRKYNSIEIELTLKEYENANEILDDEKMQVLNRLFVAAISKNNKARVYFYKFKERYKLDGAFSEEYSELKAMLESWDKQK